MTTMDKATQARRFDVAAALLRTARAGAVVHIRTLDQAAREELAGLVDWVIDYEDSEVLYG